MDGRSSIPVRDRVFSLRVRTGSETNPASYPMGIGNIAGQSVELYLHSAIHLHGMVLMHGDSFTVK
jgi:hypothetical protein